MVTAIGRSSLVHATWKIARTCSWSESRRKSAVSDVGGRSAIDSVNRAGAWPSSARRE